MTEEIINKDEEKVEAVEKKIWIPRIANKRLDRFYEHAKLIARFKRDRRGLFSSPEGEYLYHTSLINLRQIVRMCDLKPHKRRIAGFTKREFIMLYFYYGYLSEGKDTSVVFSIADVAAQIPESVLGWLEAFEIEVSADIFKYTDEDTKKEGYYILKTWLYE